MYLLNIICIFRSLDSIKMYKNPIIQVCITGKLNNLKYLVSHHGINVNQTFLNEKYSLIHFAAEYGQKEILKYLIKKGANVNAKSINGTTPLQKAVLNKKIETANYLIDQGAKINDQDSYKQTALHIAVEVEDLAMIKLLLDQGADLEIKDHLNETPLDLAKYKKKNDIIELITKTMQDNLQPLVLQIEDCVVCKGPRNEILAFLPCMHAKTCKKCCRKILEASVDEGAKCPICREKVSEFKKVFF